MGLNILNSTTRTDSGDPVRNCVFACLFGHLWIAVGGSFTCLACPLQKGPVLYGKCGFSAPAEMQRKSRRPSQKRDGGASSTAALTSESWWPEHVAAVGSHGAAGSGHVLRQRLRGGRLARRCVPPICGHTRQCATGASCTGSCVVWPKGRPWHLCLCCMLWESEEKL